jgi:predicted phage terminase large subunit-like protein
LVRPLPPDLDPSQAVAETARDYLDVYARFVYDITPAAHHREWCQRIQDVVEDRPLWLDGTTRSRKRKLLLTAPPGHAKSTYVSLVLPPWYLGRHPDQHVLFYTSIGPNASNFDGTVATVLDQSDAHRMVFPDEATRPNKARGWSSDGRFLKGIPLHAKDPSYRAVSYGSSILGGRAHGYILDDVLSQEESQSETEQAKAKNRFQGTVDTRLVPGGWAIGIMTRWHELDLPSYLAKLPDWEHVNYPALTGGDTSHPPYPWGRALWPERFPESFLQLRRVADPDLFEAYWQGDPTTLGGSIFKAKMFQPLPDNFLEKPPTGGKSLLERLVRVMCVDLNFGQKETNDWSVCMTIGVDFQTERFYLLRVARDHCDEKDHDEFISKEILLAKPHLVGILEGAYRKAGTTENLIRRLQRTLMGRVATSIIKLDETTDKIVRARMVVPYGNQGQLHVNKNASWYPEFLAECVGFPLRAHDDQVDTLSGCFRLALEYGQYAEMPSTSSYSFG